MLYLQLLPLLHKLSVNTDNGLNTLIANKLSPKMPFRNLLIINHYRFYTQKRTVGVFFGKKHRICPRAIFGAFESFFSQYVGVFHLLFKKILTGLVF